MARGSPVGGPRDASAEFRTFLAMSGLGLASLIAGVCTGNGLSIMLAGPAIGAAAAFAIQYWSQWFPPGLTEEPLARTPHDQENSDPGELPRSKRMQLLGVDPAWPTHP